MKKRIRLIIAALSVCSLFLLTSCASVYSEDESHDLEKHFGESVEVSVGFNLFNVITRGPYDIIITPYGLTAIDGTDYVELDYQVVSTPDGEPAEFATCTTAVNLLTENHKEFEYGVWCNGAPGNEFDPRSGVLEVGKVYHIYIPLTIASPFGALKSLSFLTVSDRSDYYVRSGNTYWYTF